MNGYILTTTQNTHGWVVYENDISTDYHFFFSGRFYCLSPHSFLSRFKKSIYEKG